MGTELQWAIKNTAMSFPQQLQLFLLRGETEKRACNDLHDALSLMCQGWQSARFNKMTHDKTLRSLNRLASPSLVGTVNFVKGLDHWLPFCQALKGYGGSCGSSFMTDLVFRSRKQSISYGSVKLITLVSALLVLSACSGLSVSCPSG